ncbi:B-cell receptor CD22-like isoform X2 [Genypterus blacodes]|uniref:B-cell receptor CD22-like isoform X2 n=1 Tax=Genypterus blacodes TaxID=154954 RepID=UPI003F77516A
MNILFISTLLGVAAFVVQIAASKETPKVSVSVWPSGSNIYGGDSVSLQCRVVSGSPYVWSYRWFRHKPGSGLTLNPRHLVSGDRYSITGVTREDGGSYWCQAGRGGHNSTAVFLSQPIRLFVSELLPPSLSVTPGSRQIFRGERLTVRCPVSLINSSRWTLMQFSQDFGLRSTNFHNESCSPLEGAVSADTPATCVFASVYSGNSGLYWCESTEGRSHAVSITVSYGAIILKSPILTVSEGDQVVLLCQYWSWNHNKTAFFKDGEQVITHSSFSPDREIMIIIDNVTQADEGFYKCASMDGGMESPESWLSVRRNASAVTAVSPHDTWKWILLSCGIGLLFLLPLIVWLLYHYRCGCCRFSKEDLPAMQLPQTKQDVTEVQWDLSWMEMSNLLDKRLYPGS